MNLISIDKFHEVLQRVERHSCTLVVVQMQLQVTFNRLLRMLSFYNLLAAYGIYIYGVYFNLNAENPIYQIVAANALLIALAVFVYYIKGGIHAPKRFYDELFFPAPLPFWIFIDFLVHFAPVLLLGLPRVWWAYVVSYTVILAWYILIGRKRLDYVYGKDFTLSFTDMGVFFIAPVACCMLAGMTYAFIE